MLTTIERAKYPVFFGNEKWVFTSRILHNIGKNNGQCQQ